MLVLSRKKFEQIIITPQGRAPIVITVADIRGDKVRIGILADPKTVAVHRKEIDDIKARGSRPRGA